MSAPTDPRPEPAEHGEWDALAVGWALSALDREDEERFAAHLPGCARCTAIVRESLYTVADLAYALPDEAPPPSMKTRLMAAVTAEPRSGGSSSAALSAAASSAGSSSAASAPTHEQWPLGAPHPGSPGYNADWFAQPSTDGAAGSPAQPATDSPAGGRATHSPAGGPAQPATDSPAGGRATHSPAGGPAPHNPGGGAEAGSPAGSPTTHSAGEAPAADSPVPGRARPVADGPAGRPAPSAPRPVPSSADIRRDDVGGPHTAGRSQADPVVVPMEPHRRRRRMLTGVAAAAVIALIAALGVWNLNLRSEQNNLRQIVAQREAAIQQLTANGPARVAALTQTGKPSPTRKATLVVRGDQVEIIVETLAATPADRTYWLWTLRCDNGQATEAKPVRGFTVTQSAFSVRTIGSDADAATATCFAISSEPGMATPTEPHEVQAIGQPSS